MANSRHIMAALAAGVLSSCASLPGTPVLPPPPYLAAAVDGLAAGEYELRRLPGPMVARACRGQSTMACAVQLCIIITRWGMADDPTIGLTLIHEAGHCEGWPADHPAF